MKKVALLFFLFSCRGYSECVFHPDLNGVLCRRPETKEQWSVPAKDMRWWRCVSATDWDNIMTQIENKVRTPSGIKVNY